MPIKLYTTPACPRCKQLKAWLEREGISYEERSLLDAEVVADLIARDIFIMSAPALEYGSGVLTVNELFIDERLNTELLKKALKKGG